MSRVAAIVEQTRADLVVTLSVGQVGRDLVVSLSLIDTATASVRVRASSSVVPGSMQEGWSSW